MLPQYSEEARAALPFVSRSAYRLFIYFEDQNSERLYETLLTRLGVFGNDVRVICLSGKSSIIEHHSAVRNRSIRDKTIYVLDKDFDDLLQQQINSPNLFYLGRYSIENYFLEPLALESIAVEEKPKIQKIGEALGIEGFLETIKEPLIRLTGLYLLAQEFDLGIQNTSEPIQRRVIEKTPWILSKEKIQEYEDDIRAILMISGLAASEEDISELIKSRREEIDLIRDVPGKQLVDLIRFHIGNVLDVRGIASDSFCYRLAKNCTFEDLKYLADAANAALEE